MSDSSTPEDLNRAEELDALRSAITLAQRTARDAREHNNMPGTANHYEGVADRLGRLLARLEAGDVG